MRELFRIALEEDLVLNANRHPELTRALNSTRYRGELATVLPGIYALTERRGEFDTRIAALRSDLRGLIVTGVAAARLTWWPELEVQDIGVAYPGELSPAAGFAFEQRIIPEELTLVDASLRVTNPALTVLDLIPTLGSIAVDEALRRKATTLDQLRATLALTPKRRGNKSRREILRDSRDQPWSPLERKAHQVLREAGIRGWYTNFWLMIDGRAIFLDVALPSAKIAVELDGFAYHGQREAFHQDRLRDAKLTALGWHVLRFSTETLHLMPDALRSALKTRRR